MSSPRLLGAAAGTDGEDFALLGLLLGGVGDDEAADGRLFGLGRADDDAVLQRLQVHRLRLLVGLCGGGLSGTGELALPCVEC